MDTIRRGLPILSAVSLALLSSGTSLYAGSCAGALCAGRGYASAGLDSTDAIIANVDSDGDGPGLFAVVVGTNYNGYGSNLDGYDPGTAAQFRVEDNAVIMNENTTVSGSNQLTVGGTTHTNGLLDVNAGIEGENFTVQDNTGNTGVGGTLRVSGTTSLEDNLDFDSNGTAAGGTTILGDDSSLTMGSARTVIRGGTHSGVLTLDDGDAGDGTTLSISGSGGGTPATVLQTTTDANTTTVNTYLGTSDTSYTQSTATVQAGANAITVDSGATGSEAGITIDGTVSGANSSNIGVLVTGSGQNGIAYDPATATAAPTWADVAIHSASYGDGDPSRGSAIIVTDYGIQSISPDPRAGETIYNSQGGNRGDGTVNNTIGQNSGNGSIYNTIGGADATSGPDSRVVNNFGANNGAGTVVNNFGGGTSPTQNTIGNTNAATETSLHAGASSLKLRNDSATMTGGTSGNYLSITNDGARFSDARGGPISVTGVADGSGEYDAVNVGQFASSIASVAAMSAIPDIRPGANAAFGFGFGDHMGYSAWAVGGKAYLGDTMTVQASAASGFRKKDLVYSLGMGWSW